MKDYVSILNIQRLKFKSILGKSVLFWLAVKCVSGSHANYTMTPPFQTT